MYTIDFMRVHANWRELLAAPPYCLRIVENDDLVLFKYTMGRSDYNEPIVLECRGLIVDKATKDQLYLFPETKNDPSYKTFKWETWEKCEYSLSEKEGYTILAKYFSSK